MLKLLSRITNRDIYIITTSPPKYYSNSKTKFKEIGAEIQPLNEHENAIMVFDDILGSSNGRYIDQTFIRVQHNNLDFRYLSQFCFDLPKRIIRNESNKTFLFNQTLKDIKNLCRDVAGYDMSFDDFKELC